MTEPANKPISFKSYRTCGGYAWQMNGRPEAQPHMNWCPQREEYAIWFAKHRQAPAYPHS
jgi:hypothetical protein